MTNAEKLKDVLASIFRRKGKETTKTLLYDGASESVKDEVSRITQLEKNELPVVISNPNAKYWLIITTKSVVTRSSNVVSRTENSTILDVDLGIDDDNISLIRKKSTLSQLRIKNKTGLYTFIDVEEGAPLIGVWNVLRHIALINK